MSDASNDCSAILQNISSYLDGELPVTECAAIDAHCRGCERCAAVVASLRQTVGLCREAASTPLPDAVLDRARVSVRRLLDEVQKRHE